MPIYFTCKKIEFLIKRSFAPKNRDDSQFNFDLLYLFDCKEGIYSLNQNRRREKYKICTPAFNNL